MQNFSVSTHTQTINEEIEITSVAFRSPKTQAGLEAMPRRMVWSGREYNFIDSGMQFLIKKGQHFVRLFDVSDGFASYRLRFDPDQQLWTLLSVKDTPQTNYQPSF